MVEGDAQYSSTLLYVRILTSILLVFTVGICIVEIVALFERCCIKQRSQPHPPADGSQQRLRFQLLLLGVSLANIFTICMVFLDSFFHAWASSFVDCTTLVKLMGAGYIVSFQLSYYFLANRARLAGKMHSSILYRVLSRVTEALVVLFIPCVIFPLFLTVPGNLLSLNKDGRCALRLPLYINLVFLAGNILISVSLIVLFVYPLMSTARDTGSINRTTSKLFWEVAKYNACCSIVALVFTTVCLMLFCVLNHLAQESRHNEYLLLVAHSIALIDMVLFAICMRLTTRVWCPQQPNTLCTTQSRCYAGLMIALGRTTEARLAAERVRDEDTHISEFHRERQMSERIATSPRTTSPGTGHQRSMAFSSSAVTDSTQPRRTTTPAISDSGTTQMEVVKEASADDCVAQADTGHEHAINQTANGDALEII